MVGSDAHAGVAVISTGGGLSPATFADEDVQPDDLDIVACLCTDVTTGASSTSSRRHPPPPPWAWCAEVGTGVSVDGGPDLVNAIEAEMPLGATSWGGVLLDGHG